MLKAVDFSFWNYLVIGAKVVFGDGWPSALEYAVPIAGEKLFSSYDEKNIIACSSLCLATADYIDRIASIAEYKDSSLNAVNETTDAFRKASVAMADGKISAEETKTLIVEITEAIEAWKKVVKGI